MIIALLLLLGATRPEVFTNCDMIELNHHYDEWGGEYDQLLFWEWSPEFRRHDIVAWCLYHPANKVQIIRSGKACTVKWDDCFLKTRRIIRSEIFKESYTFGEGKDPEQINRKLVPERQRPPIAAPPAYRKTAM